MLVITNVKVSFLLSFIQHSIWPVKSFGSNQTHATPAVSE